MASADAKKIFQNFERTRCKYILYVYTLFDSLYSQVYSISNVYTLFDFYTLFHVYTLYTRHTLSLYSLKDYTLKSYSIWFLVLLSILYMKHIYSIWLLYSIKCLYSIYSINSLFILSRTIILYYCTLFDSLYS